MKVWTAVKSTACCENDTDSTVGIYSSEEKAQKACDEMAEKERIKQPSSTFYSSYWTDGPFTVDEVP